MNRRNMLKTLAAVPVAGLLGCRPEKREEQPSNFRIKTVQILLEGAFTLVLHNNKPNRLTAFVPKAGPGNDDLSHDFFFNDPANPRPLMEKEQGGQEFELSAAGLKNYDQSYINPGFNDFLAETEKWRLPDRLVTINLPFPSSINFGGKPLKVTFNSGKPAMMPTNFILEYYVEEPKDIRLTCSHMDRNCEPSPHCPPGVARFFFGVAPRIKTKDPDKQREHAVKFFNFMLRTSFPDLVEKFSLKDIELSEEGKFHQNAVERPISVQPIARDIFLPTTLSSNTSRARLLTISETVDCQTGGLVVKTNSSATP